MIRGRDILYLDTKNTLIHRLDPRTKLALLLSLGILVITFDRWEHLIILAMLSFLGYPLARLSRSKYIIASLLIGTSLWGTILSQALFYAQWPRTQLVNLVPADLPVLGALTGGVYLWEEGFLYGAIQGLRVSSPLALGLLVMWTTDPQQMLTGLTKLRVPYTIAFMVVTALRFIPMVISEAATVISAQRLRGLRLTRVGFGVIRTAVNILTPMLANSLRRASTLATSVESRAFRAQRTRSHYRELHLTLPEFVAIVFVLAATASISTAKIVHLLYQAGFFYRTELRGLYEFVATYL